MKITGIESYIIEYDLEEPLGYSQQYYAKRSVHLIEVHTDEGVVGHGECFGGGLIARGNRAIAKETIEPLIVGMDPLAREVIWHKVYNLLRDHGQKGMPIQVLSGIDIALWDIAGKVHGLPLYRLLGGAFREKVPVYGYGMMLQPVSDLTGRFRDESAELRSAGYCGLKMKVGLGVREDVRLVTAVREGAGDETMLMVDANHCYSMREALPLGRELERLNVSWFEEPLAPEDRRGYCELRQALDICIAGGEAEFTRWGFRDLIEGRCVDLLQPEVCGLGGITEYQKVLALAHSHFVPVVNHCWGSAVAVAVNLHLCLAMPDLPGSAHPVQPMLEYDTTPNRFREELLKEPLSVPQQVKASGGFAAPSDKPGLGVEIDFDFVRRFQV
ncbi:MAG TPA: mandelate racemase/muconate lactonizing enzyme family protein [Devosiaceae bacterium]|jgi:D-galactarolactone cycloisomerase|nr:mandelate racemase/muconate lactonizing enzyme family protein [Devosiaceae bacterium]